MPASTTALTPRFRTHGLIHLARARSPIVVTATAHWLRFAARRKASKGRGIASGRRKYIGRRDWCCSPTTISTRASVP
jgi:hypothetical protein